jgi:hypothetical protein
MVATLSSPIVQYTLARIAEFRPIAYTVDVTLIWTCDTALDPHASLKLRWAAINRVCAAMDKVAK